MPFERLRERRAKVEAAGNPAGAATSLFDGVWRMDTVEGLPARYRLQVRAGLLDETLKLANYSAVTHLVVAGAVTWFFWNSAPKAYLVGLLTVITVAIAATIHTNRLYRRAYAEAVSEQGVSRGYKVAGLLALVLGLAWATMPIVLFAPADSNERLLVVAIAAGLISDVYVIGPLLSVSLLFAIPLILGSFVGLGRSGEPIALSVSVLLLVYATFVALSVTRMSRLSRQSILDRVRVQDQGETIGLLLNEFEENTSDWLWETNEFGTFQHVSPRVAEALGCTVEALQQSSLEVVLRQGKDARSDADRTDELLDHLRKATPFHDHLAEIRTPAGSRWLNLCGKPFHDRSGNFAGFRGVGSDVTESRAAEAHIAYLATRDALTGLSNRVVFQTITTEACAAAVSDPEAMPVSLLYLDLDGFKSVNDRAGHGTGDLLLQQVAERLRATVGAEAQVFRLGGDEFAIVQRGADPGGGGSSGRNGRRDPVRALHPGRHAGRDRGQRRHRARAAGCDRHRGSAAQGGSRALQREGGREGPLAAVRHGSRAARPPLAGARRRDAGRARQRRDRPALPTAREPAGRRGRRLRGAAAMDAGRPRRGLAGRDDPDRREHRFRHRDRAMGASQGLR